MNPAQPFKHRDPIGMSYVTTREAVSVVMSSCLLCHVTFFSPAQNTKAYDDKAVSFASYLFAGKRHWGA